MPIPYDQHVSPFNVGMSLELSGVSNSKVQITFDDITTPTALTTATGVTWFDHSVLANISANTNSNVAYAISAARLVINSGTGTVTFASRQAGLWG